MAMIQKWLESTGFEILLIVLVASTVVLVSATLIARVCRQRSAAWQNMVWRTSLLLAVLLPIAIVCLPKFGLGLGVPKLTVVRKVESNQVSSATRQNLNANVSTSKENFGQDSLPKQSGRTAHDELSHSSAEPTAKAINVVDGVIAYEWMVPGVARLKAALVVFWLLIAVFKLSQTWRAVMITRRWRLHAAEQYQSTAGIALVRYSPDVEIPLTVGVLRPAILLPESAIEWTQQRRDVVLAHEQAHVFRRDVLWNIVAAAVKGVLWWQPMSWYAHRQLVLSSEKACDDFVLHTGIGPAEYARELFALATQFRSSKQQLCLSAACVTQPPIEQRIQSILAGKLDRRNVTGKNAALIWTAAFVTILIIGSIRPFLDHSVAATTAQDQDETEIKKTELDPAQELLTVEVLVVDADGQPVPNAKIKPWAVRSSRGHGGWSKESTGGYEPEEVLTGNDGKAVVEYARYVDLEEKVKAMSITLSIDSPDHPYVTQEHILLLNDSVHKATLPKGAAINIELVCEDTKIDSEKLFVMRSDHRPRVSDDRLKMDKDSRVRIPPMENGTGQLMFAILEEDSVSHFSRIVELEIDASKGEIEERVELNPAVRIEGRLGDEVPRPVINGRVKARAISGLSRNEVSWNDWAEVKEDGTFSLAWPENTPIQITALCDGYIGKNGKSLDELQNENGEAPAREKSSFLTPQVFLSPAQQPVVIGMEPLETVYIEVEDAFGKKLEGVHASANPNVNWSQTPSRSLSQIYCFPLYSTADFLRTGKYEFKKEGVFDYPFDGRSNSQGMIELDLPAGLGLVGLTNGRHQLAAKLGSRRRRIQVVKGEENYFKYVLQPKGLDYLGDWEDLCGLVFG